jgi:lipid-binding SYLF domain-containing protein
MRQIRRVLLAFAPDAPHVALVMTKMAVACGVAGMMLALALAGQAVARDPVVEAQQTLDLFTKKDPGLKKFIETAAGYVVFPSITKGAVGVGGAHGDGILFQQGGQAVAKATVSQATIGLQAGGQIFSEVIFFENPKTFSDFKEGNFAMTANASAVALSEGAAKSAKYTKGVAIFTATNTGLMFEASVGGQKFNVKPLK